MNINNFIKSPIFKKGLGYAGVAVSAIAAINSALADQKKEKEFEELKKTVSELQKKM